LLKISSEGLRAPPFQGLDLNHCKNSTCANFGVSETPHCTKRLSGEKPQPGEYTIVGAGKDRPVMKCAMCNETFSMRNNRGVFEELSRIGAYLTPPDDPSCPYYGCSLFEVPAPLAGDLYVKFGKTAGGTPRYRCGACGRTFTGRSKPTARHRMPHKNREVFSLLINKVPLRRICEITGLSPQTVYDKIDFIYVQCTEFLGARERALLEGMPLPKLYLCTDRQTIAVNWSNRKDKRNIALQLIGTADLKSGYVFGADLNFDPSMTLDEVEAEVHINGDALVLPPYRRFARLWLREDYEKAVAEAAERKKAKAAKPKKSSADALTAQIEAAYEDAELRDDAEEVRLLERDQALPVSGVEVREQYTMYAHFQLLALLLGHAPKIRVYMDQDEGFEGAFMSAFHQWIKARRADGWFVRILKETTVDQKRKAVETAKRRLRATMAEHPGLSQYEVELLMVREEMQRMTTIGKRGDRWLRHPLPTKAEPDKQLCWLTNIGLMAEEGETAENVMTHAANLYRKGSTHSIDNFYQIVRRRLSLAERQYGSASADRRMFYGYSPYKPGVSVSKALKILKVAYNYHLEDSNGRTPAMKLGLAQAPMPQETILYFEPGSNH